MKRVNSRLMISMWFAVRYTGICKSESIKKKEKKMDRQVYNTKNKLLATVDPTIGIWYMGVKSIIFQHFYICILKF